jgi:hypothetical protein
MGRMFGLKKRQWDEPCLGAIWVAKLALDRENG